MPVSGHASKTDAHYYAYNFLGFCLENYRSMESGS